MYERDAGSWGPGKALTNPISNDRTQGMRRFDNEFRLAHYYHGRARILSRHPSLADALNMSFTRLLTSFKRFNFETFYLAFHLPKIPPSYRKNLDWIARVFTTIVVKHFRVTSALLWTNLGVLKGNYYSF